MRLRGIVKPALIIFLGLVLYLIASNVGAGWLYVTVAALAGVVLISLPLPWLGVRHVGIKRRVPVVATAGEPFECSLEIENEGRLPRYMLEVEDRFAGDTGRTVAVRVRRGETETVGYTVENPRRGIYTGGEVVVESRAPFGLFYGRRSTRAASDTVVYPRTFDVAGLPPSAVTDAEWGDRSESSTLHRGHGGEFWGVRDYRPGDPARLVAWKKSARGLPSGKLAVIELAQETHPPFVLAMSLDAGAPTEAREMVVSAGASLLLYALGFREAGSPGAFRPLLRARRRPGGALRTHLQVRCQNGLSHKRESTHHRVPQPSHPRIRRARRRVGVGDGQGRGASTPLGGGRAAARTAR
jgi:uncharacterized protein (DUF58 family)